MSGSRRARLAALVASVLAASLVMLISSSGTPTGAGPIDCTLYPTAPGCETTTTVLDTTSTEEDTTTSFEDTTTTFEEVTTTGGQAATTEEEVATTSSTLEVTTSLNVLVPGDGTEGAESTTTTTLAAATISNDGTSDGALLALIVGGLLLLAVAVSILTWRYWVATRPPLTTTVGSGHG
jgi:hypothetical protein